MAVFQYNSIDVDAGICDGTIIADTPRNARDMLREKGLTVLNIAHVKQRRASILLKRKSKSNSHEITSFIRELSVLLKTGISLLSAIDTLSQQYHGKFQTVIQDVSDKVSSGASLAESFENNSDYFDEFCVSIVAVGENTGSLDDSLLKLAEFRENSQKLRNKVITALLYPAAVFITGLTVTLFLMTFVVPKLLNTLSQSGKELPMITKMVKLTSDFLINWWWGLGLAAIAILILLKILFSNEKTRLTIDRAILHIPLLGNLIRKEIITRMSVIMASLLKSGLPFIEVIEITSRTIKNRVFKQGMHDYQSAISAGSDVAEPLRKNGIFSPMVIQMLTVGQQSGQLEEMLEQLAYNYRMEVDTATARFTSLLEPVLIIFLAILIGFIAFATILPILEMSNVL